MSNATKQMMIPWLTLMLVCVSGCQSSPRLVKGEALKPVTPLAFTAETEGVELAVTGLIAYDRPGSWMKHTYWDEYIVLLENHRPESIVIEEVVLRDVLDRSVASGVDPWALEKIGRGHEQYLKSLGAPADAYQSAHPPTEMTNAAGAATGLATFALVLSAPLIYSGIGLVAIAATPVALVDHAFNASKYRSLLLAEFNRRRLTLPIRLEPGARVTGSVFFPLTPGPEQLTMRGRAGEVRFEVTVYMPGLEGLHFTYVPDKAALKAAKPYRGLLRDGPWKPPIPARKTPPALPVGPG